MDKALLASLVSDVADGVRVLVTRDGVPLTEAQIVDRARNVVSGLIGNYRIERLAGVRYARPVCGECKGRGWRIKGLVQKPCEACARPAVKDEDFENEGRIR